MAIDLAAVRADTLGCADVAHFNNAGASLPPRQVNETVIEQLRLEERIGGYEAADQSAERLRQVYSSAAALIGATADEIALVESATRAWDIAFYGFQLQRGDRVLVDRARYPSYAVSMIQVAHRDGVVIEVIDNDDRGQLDLVALERALTTGPKLVALTHIPTDSGMINPVAAAGALCRAAGVPLLVDACQSVGQLAVDVDELGCDMLTATGRKFLRGPRGTGFLYVRADLLDRVQPLVVDTFAAEWTSTDGYRLQPNATRYESFERNFAAQLGLGAALDYALRLGSSDIEQRVLQMGDALRQRLSGVPGVVLDLSGVRQCGIVTFTVAGLESLAVYRALRADGFNTSTTRAHAGSTAAGSAMPPSRVRASVHYYNSEAELEALASVIEHLSNAG